MPKILAGTSIGYCLSMILHGLLRGLERTCHTGRTKTKSSKYLLKQSLNSIAETWPLFGRRLVKPLILLTVAKTKTLSHSQKVNLTLTATAILSLTLIQDLTQSSL